MPDAGAHQGMYHAYAVGSSTQFVGMNTESELDVAQMKCATPDIAFYND